MDQLYKSCDHGIDAVSLCYVQYDEIDIGFRLELTPKDAVSVSWTIDAKNGNVDHRYYTYYRDMHSFYGWIRYDTVEKKTTFMIMPKDFRF